MTVGLCRFRRYLVSVNCVCRNAKKSQILTTSPQTVLQSRTLKSVSNNPKNVGLPSPEETVPPEEKKGLWGKISGIFSKQETRKISDLWNENSKIIIVEGNVATNKTDFAAKLAQEFGMLCLPDITEDKYFYSPEFNCDFRDANEVLPDGKKFVDLQTFLSCSNPKDIGIGRTQMLMVRRRLEHYIYALYHVLCTGEGVVVERSVFFDIVYAAVLQHHGYMSLSMFESYVEFYNLLVSRMWRPHLIVYLSAPVEHLRERIEQRAVPYEVKSEVLSNDFLIAVDYMYKVKTLPHYQPYCEILEYDVSKLPEWKDIVQDMEKLNLTPPIDGQELKFKDWTHTDSYLDKYRKFVSTYDFNFEFLSKYLPQIWEGEDSQDYFLKMKEYLQNKNAKLQKKNVK